MNGSTLTPRTTRAPWGLIGMLGLVVAIEAGLERHHLDFTRFYIHDWRVSGRAARAVAPECDVLCFGDSLVKFGVAPRAIEPRLGRRIYNLERFTDGFQWSRGVARWFRLSPSVAGPFVRRCLNRSAVPRFHTPLIEPDGRVSRIRLSDKSSRPRPREVARPVAQANQSQLFVQVPVGEP